MTNDLFFIPMLAAAAGQPDTQDAMQRALERIAARTRHEGGPVAEHWRRFLAAIVDCGESDRKAIIEAAAIMAGQRDVSVSVSPPQPFDTESHFGQERDRGDNPTKASRSSLSQRDDTISLIILANKEMIASRSLDRLDHAPLHPLYPAQYTIALDTGRVLWEGDLTEKELVWQAASPNRPLPMAADSAQPTPEPTKTVPLPVARLAIAVYPGVEAGAMRFLRER